MSFNITVIMLLKMELIMKKKYIYIKIYIRICLKKIKKLFSSFKKIIREFTVIEITTYYYFIIHKIDIKK